MRQDTREIAELLDKAADLVEDEKLVEAEHSLNTLVKLMARWVERYLSPCKKSGHL
ncbi:hypothetical protein ES703_56349 [subsurface metagenome]